MEFCVSYSAVGADFCIYGACPFWSHMNLRCEYELFTEDELAMMMALERKKTMKEDNTPKLEYWMLDVLKAAMRDYSRARQPFISDGSLRGTVAHKFTELGKVELIGEKLQEIQTYYDEEIKEGLG